MITTSNPSHEPAVDAGRWGLAAGCLTMALAVAAALLPVVDWGPTARVVGWLLFLARLAQMAFGARRERSVRLTLIVSGLLTAAAGLAFIANPLAPYFPVANVVTLWLLVRGAWVLGRATLIKVPRSPFWLGASGAMDLVLGLLLASGLPVALLVVGMFGPTPAIVARFSLVLAASLLVTGLAEIAISRAPAPSQPRGG